MGQPGTARRGRTRMARLGLCSAVLAMLVGGCGATARDATVVAGLRVALYSAGAGADLAHAPPRAGAGKLGRAGNSEDSAKAVDRYAYWSYTDRPEAILSFLARKGPIPKVQTSGYGGAAGKT